MDIAFFWEPLLILMRRTRSRLRSGEILITGDEWPMFVYEGEIYHDDDLWKGLFRGRLLINVSFIPKISLARFYHLFPRQAFKHIFISPSSVDSDGRATRSGNAALHSMKHVTIASIAYIATQVCLPFVKFESCSFV